MKANFKDFQIDCPGFLRLIAVLLMLALITPVMTKAQTGKVNFSGTWALNAEKSNLGQDGGRRGSFGGGNFTAKQEANLLTVDRTRTNQSGESTTTTSKYTLDGKESVNSSGRGERKSAAKWSADGKTLTIVTKATYNGNEMTSTEVWTLTDASTITIANTRNDRTSKMVYEKK